VKHVWVVFAAMLLVMPCFAAKKSPVQTQSGLVTGVAGSDATITVFKGIPYAEPPVGNLRWTAPRPPRSWQGARQADHFSDACAQTFPKFDFAKTEDCLYLNVWTPAKSGSTGLPVIVWIHGGGLRVGSGREPLFDGEDLAKKGLVVVTLNYRLGIIGFFVHPELTKESAHDSSGNYGLLDQLAALQWIQRNITAFGGDPNKVTIFGQSAGALSVNCLVASPLAKGLFRAAISDSGGVGAGFGRTDMPSLEDSQKAGVKFAESVGARSLTELRALPAEKLLQTGAIVGPNVDGWFLPESVGSRFRVGSENTVPMLLGSNSDEGQHLIRSALSATDYGQRAHTDYGKDAREFLILYPSDSDESAKVSEQHQFSDQAAIAERDLADDVVRGGAKAFLYYFSYLDTGGYNSEPPTLGLKLGADHGAELPYVFGLLNRWKTAVPESDLKLQNIVMSYWTNFVKILDPNGPGLPVWKPFGDSHDAAMVLDQSVGMRLHPRAAQLDFLQAHPVGVPTENSIR
jgi:para-nitrobenzyl esterase